MRDGRHFQTTSVLTILLAWVTFAHQARAADFSDEAMALPFPPDAEQLEFSARVRVINFQSQSPLKSLAAFYLKEMAARGWEHDESAAEIDDDSIELTFRHDSSQVDIRFSQWSKEVRIRMDCKNVQFTDTDDPAKLAAAGIPVSRATLFIHREIPLPDSVKEVRYDGDGALIMSTMNVEQAFQYFSRVVQGKGFRQSRRPILTETRNYTEFGRGTIEVSVNVFSHEVGSRTVLEYEDSRRQPPIPPLAAVASLPIQGGRDEPPSNEPDAEGAAPKSISVNDISGSATVTYGGRKHVFPHAVCFQTKDRGDYATMVVYSKKPIPYNKMQSLVSTEDDPYVGDLYDFSSPEHFVIQLGEYLNFNLSISGVGIGGEDIEGAKGEITIESGRASGKIEMPAKVVLSKPISFTATLDAVIVTPETRIVGPADSVMKSENPMLADSPVPMPEGVEDVSRSGTNFRKEYHALVAKSPAEVLAFYRAELAASGWRKLDESATENSLQFENETMELSVSLRRKGSKTEIEIVTRAVALAKKEGIFPEPGKGRLILANAHSVGVVFTIGKTDYPVRAGLGAKDFKQALNYSVAPGTYTVVIKVPGERPATERIQILEGSTWGIVAMPTGGYLPMQMY